MKMKGILRSSIPPVVFQAALGARVTGRREHKEGAVDGLVRGVGVHWIHMVTKLPASELQKWGTLQLPLHAPHLRRNLPGAHRSTQPGTHVSIDHPQASISLPLIIPSLIFEPETKCITKARPRSSTTAATCGSASSTHGGMTPSSSPFSPAQRPSYRSAA